MELVLLKCGSLVGDYHLMAASELVPSTALPSLSTVIYTVLHQSLPISPENRSDTTNKVIELSSGSGTENVTIGDKLITLRTYHIQHEHDRRSEMRSTLRRFHFFPF
jgi:hypothetical protein